MKAMQNHPINPDTIPLCFVTTPNGVTISIPLYEREIAYDAHLAEFGEWDQFTSEFFTLDPDNKIPARTDVQRRLTIPPEA